MYEMGQRGGGGVNTGAKDWGVGELEFEALMRMLDNSVGFLVSRSKSCTKVIPFVTYWWQIRRFRIYIFPFFVAVNI